MTKAKELLLSDEGPDGPAPKNEEIVSQTGIALRTLERLRKRCHEVGPMPALEPIPRADPPRKPALNDEQLAQLTRLACSDPPPGCARWALTLFAEKLVQLEIVESISRETIRKALKKRPEAMVGQTLVRPAKIQRGLCGLDGRYSRGLPTSPRPFAPPCLFG
ncbi:MAG: helix-turn-helix domain-containing protein [Cumulibacter sp.]